MERGIKGVLFVCTGNVARSPIAASMFRKLLDGKPDKEGIRVYSAGTKVKRGLPPPSFARFALEEGGIDISNHLSAPITQELVEDNDLILAMDKDVKQEIINSYPESNGKIFTMREFVGLPEGKGIVDPKNMGLEVYMDCAREIKECLEVIVEKLA